MNKKILFTVNSSSFFISHRLPIAIKMKDLGYEVHICCNFDMPNDFVALRSFTLHHLPWSNSINLYRNIILFFNFFLLILKIKTSIFHLIIIKPIIFGGILTRIISHRSVLFSFAGLGSVFSSNKLKYKFILFFLLPIYKFALNKKGFFIFQTCHDRSVVRNFLAFPLVRSIIINGSGIDYKKFNRLNNFKNKKILFASRLLIEKGISDFIEAALIIKKNPRYKDVSFIVAGSINVNDSGYINLEYIRKMHDCGIIEYLGFVDNIEELMSKCSIFVFPSYYGEGVPKVLIEANASGLPCIASNIPGCRSVIKNRLNGYLIPVRNPLEISKKIIYLLSHNSELIKMSKRSKCYSKKFDINLVVKKHVELYKDMLSKNFIEK